MRTTSYDQFIEAGFSEQEALALWRAESAAAADRQQGKKKGFWFDTSVGFVLTIIITLSVLFLLFSVLPSGVEDQRPRCSSGEVELSGQPIPADC